MAHRQHRQIEGSSRVSRYLRSPAADDGMQGQWPRRKLEQMDQRFGEALRRAFADDARDLPKMREWLK